ncbi:MAG: DUF222 domain-containing protein [Myxococcales bacterium]|nr:DUF222 domain-containing protein [Myxococcales bacterium]
MDAPRTGLSRDELADLGEQIAEHASHIDAATHRLLADIRTFDNAGGWSKQGARSAAEWLSWRLGWSGNRAREHVRVANALGNLPRIDDALRRAEVSYCKVRAMTRVATPETEELLLEDAKHCTGIQLEEICRKYAAVRRGLTPTPEDDKDRRRIIKRDLDDGMVSIQAMLHPEEAELIWTVLTRIARERDAGQFSRVDALVEIVDQVARGTSPDRAPTEIVVTVPLEVLTDPHAVQLVGATTRDGSCLSAETARRLACDCGVVSMVEDADGNCRSISRKTRTLSAALKRAMLQRDKTCRFPGCGNKVFLDGHHAVHWAHGGETSLANVLAICSFHHRFMHEYGYRVEMDEHQQPRFFDPQSRVVPAVIEPSTREEAGLRMIERANAGLAITPATAFPRWDGNEPNYDWIVQDLCRAERRANVSAETSDSVRPSPAADPSEDRASPQGTHDCIHW